MKLVCDKHRRRVHAFQTPLKHAAPAGKETERTHIVTVHRNDGTHCDTGILRLGPNHLFSPEEVVSAILPLPHMVAIRQEEAAKQRAAAKTNRKLTKGSRRSGKKSS